MQHVGYWWLHWQILSISWSADAINTASLLDGLRNHAVNSRCQRKCNAPVLHSERNSQRLQQFEDVQSLLWLVLPTLLLSSNWRSPKCIPHRRWGGLCYPQVPSRASSQQMQSSPLWYMEHQWPDSIQGNREVYRAAAETMGLFPRQVSDQWQVQEQVETDKIVLLHLPEHDSRCLRQLCHLWVLWG